MILLDTNLLVYAHVASLPQHEKACLWLDGKMSGTARVGLPWASLLGFARIVSHPRIFSRPSTLAGAWKVVESWLDCPVVWTPTPTEQHRDLLGRMIATAGNRSHLVSDAHLAALAIEHGLTLCSTDGDFGRFPGLRWENPLATTQG